MIDSKIEWCDSTFNGWEGCTNVGPGCDNCYAENRNARFGGGTAPNWGPGAPRRRTSASNWHQPILWNRDADAFERVHGRRRRVFCSSLADVFDNEVDPAWRRDLFALIARTPRLDWLLLTKRIGNATSMLRDVIETMVRDADGVEALEPPLWPWPNVWLGATVVNQAEADRDVPKLLAVPARVRFLSIEPMLGPVDLVTAGALFTETGNSDPLGRIINQREAAGCYDGEALIDWVIVGGESGPRARPMHVDWPRSLRDQCAAAGVPFLFKQWGEWLPLGQQMMADAMAETLRNVALGAMAPLTMRFHRFDDGTRSDRHGKKFAGRHLDGRTHDGFPA